MGTMMTSNRREEEPMNSPNQQPGERVAAATDHAEAAVWERARDAAVSAWLANAPAAGGA